MAHFYNVNVLPGMYCLVATVCAWMVGTLCYDWLKDRSNSGKRKGHAKGNKPGTKAQVVSTTNINPAEVFGEQLKKHENTAGGPWRNDTSQVPAVQNCTGRECHDYSYPAEQYVSRV